jgi:ribosome-associated translation inhibitor RaiA
VPRDCTACRLLLLSRMSIVIDGLGEDRALRTLIAGKVTSTLARLRVTATGVRVLFSDENGPKGGIDTRCSVTLDVPHRPELHTDTVAPDARLAFEQAFAALERQIERDRDKGRVERRHPKKYYLAKRLLEPEATPQSTPEAAAPRRRRRRSA